MGFWDFFWLLDDTWTLLAEDAEENHQPAQLKMLLQHPWDGGGFPRCFMAF